MTNYYAIKQPNKTLWKSKFTQEQVFEKLDSMAIGEDYLICRLGRADFSVELRAFVADPQVFTRQSQKEATRRAREKEIAGEIGYTTLLKVAISLFVFWLACRSIAVAWGKLDLPFHHMLRVPLIVLLVSSLVGSGVAYVLGSIHKGRLVKKIADREEADGLYDSSTDSSLNRNA